MARKKIVFLGSKEIGAFCFEHLLTQCDSYGIELIAVATKNNPSLDTGENVASLAKKHGILKLDGVKDIPRCDIIISVQHHEILKQEHINRASELSLNLHMAPLPEYRGCNQFSFAIVDGKKEFGTTLHKMTAGIDDGDIIAERRFELAEDIWVEELYQQTLSESKLLFKESIGKIIDGAYQTVSQQTLIKARGTSYHFRDEIYDLKQIEEDWSEEKKKLHVRATYKKGFEPPYALVNGEKKYYDKESFSF